MPRPRRSPISIRNNIDQYIKNTENNDAQIKRIKGLIQIERAPPQNNESSPGVMNNLRKKARDLINNPASIFGFGVGSTKKKGIESNKAIFKNIKNTEYIENKRNTTRKRSTRDRFKSIARRMVAKQKADQQRADQIRELEQRADQIRKLAHAPPRGRTLYKTSSVRNPMFPPKRQSKSNNTNNKNNKNKNPFANLVGGKTRKNHNKKN